MFATNTLNSLKAYTTAVVCGLLLLFAAPNATAQALPTIDNKGTIRTIYNGMRDWVLADAYMEGQFVVRDNIIYRTNAAIAANTAFAEGTTGATWTLISGADGNHVVGTVDGNKPDTTPTEPTAANLPDSPVNGDSVTEAYDDFVVHYSYDGTNWTSIEYAITGLWDADTDTGIQVEESADEDKIRFDTAGAERMIIDDTGNVGVGELNPTDRLHVSGDTRLEGALQVSRPLAPILGPVTNTDVTTIPNNGGWTTLLADVSSLTNITPVALSFGPLSFSGNPGVTNFGSNTTTNGIVVADATTVVDALGTSYWFYRQEGTFIKVLKVEFRLNGNALETREQDVRYRSGTSVAAGNQNDAYFSGSGWTGGEYRLDLVRVSSQTSTPSASDGSVILTAISDTGNVGVGVLNPTDRLHVSGDTRLEGALQVSRPLAPILGPVTNTDVTTIPNNGGWTTLLADVSSLTNITPVALSFGPLSFSGNPGVTNFGSNTTTNGIVVADATTVVDALGTSYWFYRQEGTFIKVLKVEFRLNGNALETREQDVRYRSGTSVAAGNQNDAYFSGSGWTGGEYRLDLVRVSSQTSTPSASDGSVILTAISDTGNVGVGVLNPTDRLHVSGDTRIEGALKDSNNEAGTIGQVLLSTATGTKWVSLFLSLTTAERDALTPTAGLVIFNTTTNLHQVYDGTAWSDLY